ncbi:hypothetical protein GSY74_03825 [Sulfurovum sp. bin170]|uniref:hypothetical protein n=1 Tax=Sulfurovum sp. bin170 TaxID=2695268 RepID=UPI0013DF6B13|nr:hypothetical protein [Sulfurovum sp. bin170]NEW60401.1 hypothetical protein [Sulfurovum sp. bin170]
MKLYYYAHTGHKNGLDRLKKATALLKEFDKKGLDTLLLVNDFRASLVAREFGIADSVHIETIQDIDAIATHGDVVIIDSPEDDRGRLEKYCREFRHVFRFAQSEDDASRYGETVLDEPVVIDEIYFEEYEKEDRTVFFLSDSDADKTILSNADFFKDMDMELLLGHYFYVKYEDDLAKIFKKLHEAEEYIELICKSERIVTTSLQCVFEARVSGAKVVYILTKPLSVNIKKILSLLQVETLNGFDRHSYQQVVFPNTLDCHRNTQKAKKIVSNMMNIINL